MKEYFSTCFFTGNDYKGIYFMKNIEFRFLFLRRVLSKLLQASICLILIISKTSSQALSRLDTPRYSATMSASLFESSPA